MRKILYLMCGVAGSGKSTYITNKILDSDNLCIHHSSRDHIRFSLVKENEEYFSREDEVFNKFCEDIQKTLNSDVYDVVFADATHLTSKSRMKTLDRLNLENVDIIPVYLDVPLEEILRRNAQRSGRKFVPETVIKNMYKSIRFPMFDENKYEYKSIIRVDSEGYEIIYRKDGITYV